MSSLIPKSSPRGGGLSAPNGPNGPLRSSDKAKVGDPPLLHCQAQERRASRGTSCALTCGM
eukprot:910983-Alexandrium_andersonii.AAC.1